MLDFIRSPINPGKEEDDIINFSYRPADRGLGDCCFASDESGLHCFYISRMNHLPADCHGKGQESSIGHSVGKGALDVADISDAIRIRKGMRDSRHVWAPSIVWGHGQWHMFYTAVDENLYQTIAVAHSGDLFHWKVEGRNTIIDCKDFPWAQSLPDGYTNCRDPYVVCFGDMWYCYYTVLQANGNPGMGVCTSKDLRAWYDMGNCLERPWQNGENSGTELCESPCVFQKEGLYYLVYNQGMSIKYAVSDCLWDFHGSAVYSLFTEPLSGFVPYNFELLDADTGLFGYLWGGYFSMLRYGFCDIENGKITIRKIKA